MGLNQGITVHPLTETTKKQFLELNTEELESKMYTFVKEGIGFTEGYGLGWVSVSENGVVDLDIRFGHYGSELPTGIKPKDIVAGVLPLFAYKTLPWGWEGPGHMDECTEPRWYIKFYWSG